MTWRWDREERAGLWGSCDCHAFDWVMSYPIFLNRISTDAILLSKTRLQNQYSYPTIHLSNSSKISRPLSPKSGYFLKQRKSCQNPFASSCSSLCTFNYSWRRFFHSASSSIYTHEAETYWLKRNSKRDSQDSQEKLDKLNKHLLYTPGYLRLVVAIAKIEHEPW